MIRIISYILILTVLLTNCGESKGSKSSCSQNANALSLMHDDESREYLLYLPSSYNGNTSIPLLFNFHGFGGTASDYVNQADMRSLVDTENFILVYPQGTCLNDSPHWNASLPSADNKSDADDFGFMESLINEISSNYNVDEERIYACGYSNGGMFAYGLACYKSNLFAAVGSISGVMLDMDCSPSHPMPIISIHGTSDGVLPYNGSSDYNSVEIILDYWNNLNNINSTPIVNSLDDNGTTIEHYQYSGGDNDVSVEHYKIVGGDHVWFDINYQGNNTDDLIWEFMSRYDINGLR